MFSIPVKFKEKEREQVVSESEDVSAIDLSRRSKDFDLMEQVDVQLARV